MSNQDSTGTEIVTQIPLFTDTETPQPHTTYTTVQLAMEAVAVSEPSRDAQQPDLFEVVVLGYEHEPAS